MATARGHHASHRVAAPPGNRTDPPAGASSGLAVTTAASDTGAAGRLPPIDYQGGVWNLPLSWAARDLLAAYLLHAAGQPTATAGRDATTVGRNIPAVGRCQPPGHFRDSLVALLRIDPPLLIDAVLSYRIPPAAPHPTNAAGTASPPVAPLTLTLDQLANGLLDGLPARLLAQPRMSPPLPLDHAACDRLRKKFLRMPLHRWLAAADQWLELAASSAPAPPKWGGQSLDQLFALVLTDDQRRAPSGSSSLPWSYRPAALELAQLASQLHQAADLQQRFTSRLEAAKRAALKQLAYGLSHEINNPLANISTRAQTLMRWDNAHAEQPPTPHTPHQTAPTRQSPATTQTTTTTRAAETRRAAETHQVAAAAERQRTLQRIVDQAMRAHEMTADLMFYAHPPSPRTSVFDLWSAVRSIAGQAAPLAAERAIELSLPEQPPAVPIRADRAMVGEAIRSLLRNAIEAIGIDGKVHFSVLIDPLGAAPSPGDTAARGAAVLTIADSGPGLSAAAAVHAFDPYYSGREAGRGLGVGLCRAEAIARIHGGHVQLTSGPAGCVAQLGLPLATADTD